MLASTLADLDWHWGGAYEISVDPAGRWVALPRDGSGDILSAPTEPELRIKIRSDYFRRFTSCER